MKTDKSLLKRTINDHTQKKQKDLLLAFGITEEKLLQSMKSIQSDD